MSDFEMLLTAWLQGGEIPEDFKPTSNVEEYLLAILNGVDDDIDPKSRADVLLDAIATKYAGYADGLEELRDETGMTAHHVPGGDTPEEVAAFLRTINGFALEDLTAKGATGVARNTLAILDAYSNLPSGGGGGVDPFVLTDYIESSGTQYIDTGYIVQSNTKFEAVYSGITSSLSGQYPTLYGARTDYQNNSCQFLVRQTTTDRGFYTWSDRNGSIDENIVSMSSWFNRKIVLTADKNGLLLQSANAFYTTSGISNAYSGTPVNKLPIFICALNNGGSAPSDTFLTGKLYLFRIYEGDTLVHEFLPYKDENNVACLKDTVTGNIKYNAGTGAFTYGTDA